MNHLDHLRLRASHFWKTHSDLPTNLFNEMVKAGLDVDQERNHYLTTEQL